MTPEKQLETEIDRELKALRELPAPDTLLPRVMAALESRAEQPAYRCGWQSWPVPLRSLSLALSLALIATLCFGLWKLPQTEAYAAASRQVAGRFWGLDTAWATAGALLNAIPLALKQLGVWPIAAGLLVVGMAWAACLGLGTFYVRMAFAKR